MVSFMLYYTNLIHNTAQSVRLYADELSKQPKFYTVKVDITEPCKIPYLKQYCTDKNCVNTVLRSNRTINLLNNPETNTGYRYGASDVWTYIYSLGNDLEYQSIINGIKFSILVHICRFYVNIGGEYFANIKLFTDCYEYANYVNFLWLLRFVYSAFGKYDFSKHVLNSNEMHLIEEIKNVITSTIRDVQRIDIKIIHKIQACLKIINCVSCEKCKLWGKIQFSGLITAIKINNDIEDQSMNDIVLFVNLMARLTTTANETINICKYIQKNRGSFS